MLAAIEVFVVREVIPADLTTGEPVVALADRKMDCNMSG
jgi:hypothetical protein